MGKIAKIVIYDKARLISGTNYDSPRQRWVVYLHIDKNMVCKRGIYEIKRVTEIQGYPQNMTI